MSRPASQAADTAAAPLFPPGGVLALDLSRVTGWCYGLIGANAPHSGTWHLTEKLEGGRYAQFENALAIAMDAWAPSHLVCEAPLSFEALMRVSNATVMRQQYTLEGIARLEAWRGEAAFSTVGAEIVRRELLGQSRFAKDEVKRRVVRWCWQQGWHATDHNAADATLTWAWHCGQVRSRGRGPLFAEAAE